MPRYRLEMEVIFREADTSIDLTEVEREIEDYWSEDESVEAVDVTITRL